MCTSPQPRQTRNITRAVDDSVVSISTKLCRERQRWGFVRPSCWVGWSCRWSASANFFNLRGWLSPLRHISFSVSPPSLRIGVRARLHTRASIRAQSTPSSVSRLPKNRCWR